MRASGANVRRAIVVALGRKRSLGFLDAAQRGRRLARAHRLRQCLAQVDRPGGSSRQRRSCDARRHLRLARALLARTARRLVVQRSRDVPSRGTARHARFRRRNAVVGPLLAGGAGRHIAAGIVEDMTLPCAATPPHEGGGSRRATAAIGIPTVLATPRRSACGAAPLARARPIRSSRPVDDPNHPCADQHDVRGRSHCADDPTNPYADQTNADRALRGRSDEPVRGPARTWTIRRTRTRTRRTRTITTVRDQHERGRSDELVRGPDERGPAERGRSDEPVRGPARTWTIRRTRTRTANADDPTHPYADQPNADDPTNSYADQTNADDPTNSYADDPTNSTRTDRGPTNSYADQPNADPPNADDHRRAPRATAGQLLVIVRLAPGAADHSKAAARDHWTGACESA